MGHFLTTGLVESLAEAPWEVAPGTNEILMRIRFALGSLLRSQHKSIWWPTWDLRNESEISRFSGSSSLIVGGQPGNLPKFGCKSLMPNEATSLGTDETSSRSQAWTVRANDGHGASMLATLWTCRHNNDWLGLLWSPRCGQSMGFKIRDTRKFWGKWKLSLGTKILRHVRIPTKC